ncbi:MAG: family 1 glycosylhydrolase [Kofleriaceae bacterium]
MWAGIECTVNRVGDRFFDQVARTGHDHRIGDLDLIAGLGVRAIRYPVLWERTAPGALEDADWSWPDARLARLRALELEPIVGLVHHGSGPAYTSLIDPAFPALLADYARAVARRYPWVTAFTPVNEPLTTARFSGLYGHWYPHGTDDTTFVRALLGECTGTVMAMRAIREVIPAARLYTTEDLGHTQASPGLQYQAEFENERRWLANELIAGRVERDHALYGWLLGAGATERELAWLRDNPCVPDLIGCNYYITSERYLDANLAVWPAHTHGGNGRDRYADVEAVRAGCFNGVETLLVEAWERLRLPLAITEAHLGCTREQQLRWLRSIHEAGIRARDRGVDLRAITAWSMFGAFDWHCLVTRDEGIYEPGVFDIRGPVPRATALAELVRALATDSALEHPALAGDGWWERAAS